MTDHAEVTFKIPGEMLRQGPVRIEATLSLKAAPAEPEPEPLPANSQATESEPA